MDSLELREITHRFTREKKKRRRHSSALPRLLAPNLAGVAPRVKVNNTFEKLGRVWHNFMQLQIRKKLCSNFFQPNTFNSNNSTVDLLKKSEASPNSIDLRFGGV
jgi:hypothetical protein